MTAGDITAEAPYLLNATYAGVNDVHAMLGLPPFGIKYEKCEIILCTVDESLKNTGITVMDGPFIVRASNQGSSHCQAVFCRKNLTSLGLCR